MVGQRATKDRSFNPRRPVKGATAHKRRLDIRVKFQSTRPVKGATRGRPSACSPPAWFQSTRPVKGATFAIGTGVP